MGAGAYIGRVGGLAVALGVGAAVATGHGVASADTSASDSQSGSSVTSSPAADPSAGTTSSTQPSTSTQSTSQLDIGAILRNRLKNRLATAISGSPYGTTSKRSATPTGVTVGTGGSQLSHQTSKDGSKTTSEEPDEEEQMEVVGSEGPQAVVPPAPWPTPTLAAEARTNAREPKSSSGLEAKSAQASVTSTPALTSPVRAAEVVAEKVVAGTILAAKGAVDTVAQRAAETVVFKGSALQAPVMKMHAAAPVEMTASAADTAAPVTVPRLVSGLLAAFGLSALAATTPLAPAELPWSLALLALGSRREFERSVSTVGRTTSTTPVATAALKAAPLATAAVTTPVTTRIGWVTGANSLNDTVNRFGIAGTDVGVMWDNGITGDNPATTIVEQRQVLIAFGDTFSGAGMTGTWRMNTLFRSADPVLSDGLYVPNGIIHDPGAYSGSPMTYPNFSREIIGNYHYGIGPEVTMIPTAGISVPGAGVNGATRQYVNFMAVRSWDTPGRWTTNYSAIAFSDDNGQNWTVVPASSVRTAA
ncbi:MAG: hypothetical protein JWR37_147, partial [Mycobacterium sp.]|nr:hypothetical protein [Mycobacterium sp.]